MQTRALVYNASLRINERRRQTFKVTLCRFFTCFLYLSWVSQVEGGDCPLKLNPSSVVVEYGSSVSVNCSMDVTADKIGWEAQVGSVSLEKAKLITWKVSNLSRWDIRPQCYMKYNRSTECESFLPITIYKTPDSVSINTVDHRGPMREGSQYDLQCDIVNVAPRNLTVKWFKGETEVKTETFSDTIKTPETKTSTLQITANRSDDGVQYRCEAELELGEDGPQPPPKMTSEPFNITVYFKPAINETKLPSTVSVIRGYPVRLVCEADGNPTPNISWSNGSGSRLKTTNESLTLDEVPDGDAVYTCTAVNILGKDTKKVEVFIKENYVPILVGIIVPVAVAIIVIFIFIYITYYKKNKDGPIYPEECCQKSTKPKWTRSTIHMRTLSSSNIFFRSVSSAEPTVRSVSPQRGYRLQNFDMFVYQCECELLIVPDTAIKRHRNASSYVFICLSLLVIFIITSC